MFLGALAVNVQVHDTYFVVAHFHYVMVGGMMIAFLGGLHYWWPKITGRMFNDSWGRLAALLIFVGFNLTFFPQFLMGTHGMPRRYYDYSAVAKTCPEIWMYNVLSSLGAYLLAVGHDDDLRIPVCFAVRRTPGAGQPVGRRHVGMAMQFAAALR